MTGKKIHVAYLITDLDVGGAERNLAMLAVGLDARRFAVSVASLMPPGKTGRILQDRGIPVTDIHMTTGTDLRGPGRILAWLRRTRPDILHTWLFHANVLGACAAALARVPVVVWSIRVAEPRRSHLGLAAVSQALTSCVLTNSESLRRYMIEQGIRGDRLAMIPNAVDLGRFARPRDVSSVAQRTVLFVGRLTRQKGVDVLLRAAQEITRRVDVRFLIVGDGPDRADLRHLADELDLNNVEFTGRSDRVPELLSQADVLVLPSRWEGMPNVVLEAFAARCPVVATDVTGIRDLIRSGENGLLVPSENPGELAEAIALLIGDPLLRERLAEKGHETATRHSIHAMVQAHESLYQRLFLQA